MQSAWMPCLQRRTGSRDATEKRRSWTPLPESTYAVTAYVLLHETARNEDIGIPGREGSARLLTNEKAPYTF